MLPGKSTRLDHSVVRSRRVLICSVPDNFNQFRSVVISEWTCLGNTSKFQITRTVSENYSVRDRSLLNPEQPGLWYYAVYALK